MRIQFGTETLSINSTLKHTTQYRLINQDVWRARGGADFVQVSKIVLGLLVAIVMALHLD